MRGGTLTLMAVWLVAARGAAAPAAREQAEKIGFNAQVRPILAEKCFACHGFDAKKREAGLRLDTREGALARSVDSGRAAIVPGRPEASEMLARITSSDPDQRMPPPEAHKEVSASELATLREWIRQGAEYEEHWAYTPIRRPAVPRVAGASQPIDAFVRQRLAAENLTPSAPADARTLIRRMALDLTGLPPTAAETEEFVAAAGKDRQTAVSALIERLLASPHYGERMAVPWLDAVRFADTVGYHGDQNQDIFPYRDYVIGAFNANKRFDQFTREQLAGDLLANPTAEQLVASGFNRLNMMTREGGAQPKEYLARYAASRVRAIGTAWLGQTTGCAECHDHKFDPITTRDFYSLAAFFDDLRQWGVYTDYGYTPNPDLRGFSNDHPFPPQLLMQPASLRARLAQLRGDALALVPASHVAPAGWQQSAREFLAVAPDGWAPAKPVGVTGGKQTVATPRTDGVVVFTGTPGKEETLTVELAPQGTAVTALQLEVLPVDEHGGNVGRGRAGGFSVRATFALKRGESLKPLEIGWRQADRFLPQKYSNGAAPLMLGDVWQSGTATFVQPGDDNRQPHHAVFLLKAPLAIETGDRIVATLVTSDLGSMRLATTLFAEPVPGMAAAPDGLAKALATSNPSPAEQQLVRASHALANLPESQVPGWRQLRTSIRECRAGYALTMISQPLPEKQWHVTRVLPRGNWQDESGEIVAPAVPHFLPQLATGGRRASRLDLANWLTSNDNPLTARHFVNRLWKQFFGSGLSNVLDDLGSQGEWPSHPELLDWLAAEFRDSGWDVKHMVRLIVSSQTYQQECSRRAEVSERDPQNRLLASQAPRRLDAEFVRDNALAISGLLDTRLTGGPSVRPPQPADYYSALQFPSRDYIANDDDQRYRRGVYMHWQRTFLHPMLAAFDAPSREECAADRLLSNSPQQALTLLNDPNFYEAAQAFAQSLLAIDGDEARITTAYQRALARQPTPRELAQLREFLATTRKFFNENQDDARKAAGKIPGASAEAAAMVQFARVILNLHETITRY